MILTVTLNPALDKTVQVADFSINSVNRVREIRLDAGGKGINVCKVVHSLGGQCLALGILGGDTGRYIWQALDTMGIANDFVFVPESTRTNLKVVDAKNHTYTDINEPGAPVGAQVLAELSQKLFARVTGGDIVVFAGTAPDGVPEDIFARWATRCRALGAFVYADLDGGLLASTVEAAPYMIKPNDAELARLVGRPVATMQDCADGARLLLGKGIRLVAVSLGSRGALFAHGDGMMVAENAPVAVKSTVGAGDAMLAAFAFCHARGMAWQEAAVWAMATANAKVAEEGSSPPSLDKIKALLPKIKLRPL